jgi:PQQ-dependent catabolism-associated CXXCW motif protein
MNLPPHGLVSLALMLACATATAQDRLPKPPAAAGATAAPAGGQGQPPTPRPPTAQGDAVETQDFGVAPRSELHGGPMHGPTPSKIPGGLLVTTGALVKLLQGGQGKLLVFDVLGGPEVLPGARAAVPAHQSGHFKDEVQRGFGDYLQQTTQGDKSAGMVFYCQSVQCWMSYNAALRAIALGYTNVLWYRGGIEAWKAAGQPVQPTPKGPPQAGAGAPRS